MSLREVVLRPRAFQAIRARIGAKIADALRTKPSLLGDAADGSGKDDSQDENAPHLG